MFQHQTGHIRVEAIAAGLAADFHQARTDQLAPFVLQRNLQNGIVGSRKSFQM